MATDHEKAIYTKIQDWFISTKQRSICKGGLRQLLIYLDDVELAIQKRMVVPRRTGANAYQTLQIKSIENPSVQIQGFMLPSPRYVLSYSWDRKPDKCQFYVRRYVHENQGINFEADAWELGITRLFPNWDSWDCIKSNPGINWFFTYGNLQEILNRIKNTWEHHHKYQSISSQQLSNIVRRHLQVYANLTPYANEVQASLKEYMYLQGLVDRKSTDENPEIWKSTYTPLWRESTSPRIFLTN